MTSALDSILGHIGAEAEARGESLADGVRHYLLHGIVNRIAAVPLARVMFVLRGGLLTRAWLTGRGANRVTRDLDLVGDFTFDRAVCVDRFARALAHDLPDDGIVIDRSSLHDTVIWGHTEFPGVRFTLALGLGATADQQVTVDVGFHDPLVPPALDDPPSIRAIRPETQVAWKLHALAETRATFRPKDVADLLAITRHVALVDADLAPAIAAAFTSRRFAIADARATLSAAHWATKPSRIRWDPYRKSLGELAPAIAAIAHRLAPALAALETTPYL